MAKFYGFASFAKVMEFNTALSYLDFKKGEKVCDLGCGLGYNDIMLSLTGAEIYGVDIDKDALSYARNAADRLQAHVHYCASDLTQALTFSSESFDKAVSYCVLEHLNSPETFLKEVHRILGPQGKLVISVDSFSHSSVSKNLVSVHKKLCRVVRYYTREELGLLLNKCNFSVEKCCFIIKSPVSSFLFRSLLRNYFRSELYHHSGALHLLKVLSPFLLILCTISDRFYDDNVGGYWLALVAAKSK